MKYPTTRIVFDRKHTATTTIPALIQIEILFCGKKKYVSTGVKVRLNEFDRKRLVCNCFDMISLNKRIQAVKTNIDGFITDLIEKELPFTFDLLTQYLANTEKKQTFLEFIEERIEKREDIWETIRKIQRKIVSSLRLFGKIINTEDLTKRNIMAYDDFLRAQGIKQTTIYY